MKQPTPEQIAAAIDNLSEYRECLKQAGYDAEANSGHIYEAALFALRFLQKAMGGPSFDVQFIGGGEVIRHEMTDSGKHETAKNVFKAMRDQMLKEVSDK